MFCTEGSMTQALLNAFIDIAHIHLSTITVEHFEMIRNSKKYFTIEFRCMVDLHCLVQAHKKIDRPIRQKPYGIPQAYKEKVMEELEEMEKNGIIEQSDSEWASPMVIVTKKDGEVRLCIDYRRLSAVTKFDAYPTKQDGYRIYSIILAVMEHMRQMHLMRPK